MKDLSLPSLLGVAGVFIYLWAFLDLRTGMSSFPLPLADWIDLALWPALKDETPSLYWISVGLKLLLANALIAAALLWMGFHMKASTQADVGQNATELKPYHPDQAH